MVVKTCCCCFLVVVFYILVKCPNIINVYDKKKLLNSNGKDKPYHWITVEKIINYEYNNTVLIFYLSRYNMLPVHMLRISNKFATRKMLLMLITMLLLVVLLLMLLMLMLTMTTMMMMMMKTLTLLTTVMIIMRIISFTVLAL